MKRLTLVVVAILAILVPALAGAQAAPAATPAPAAAANPCTIRAITAGSVIVKGENTAPIAIRLQNCGEVVEITAEKLSFIDIVSTSTTVTARIKAEDDAVVGPTSFKLKNDKGVETESPKSVFLLVLDKLTASIRTAAVTAQATAAAAQATAAAAQVQIRALKAETSTLENALGTVAATRPTTDEVRALLAPIQARIADLEKVTAALVEGGKINDARDEVLRQGVEYLAENQKTIADTQVKAGFWGGKKPLSPEAAAAAERIRQTVKR